MADGRALCLVLFIGVFTLTNTASVTEKRSPHVVGFTLGQLSSKVVSLESRLEASLKKNRNTKTALESEMSWLKTQLAAKRCESGYEYFQPNKQASVTDANGRLITRTHTKHVTFSSSFSSVPKVTAGITHIDADYRVNTRIYADVIDLQASGFDLDVVEWSDSNTYGVGIMWMACSN